MSHSNKREEHVISGVLGNRATSYLIYADINAGVFAIISIVTS